MLPDDALLAIFDFCADENEMWKREIEAWQTLVHVCRRWRTVVFGSPRRLNLRLICTNNTPTRDTLDVWPALPLVIQCFTGVAIENVDNVVAVLERSNRVCQIFLPEVSSSDLEQVSAAMQVPFPELTILRLGSTEKTLPVLPDSFLDGSAVNLRDLYFDGIPFPGLPKLLSSATRLVNLDLVRIPHSGYISPEAMITAFPALTSLRNLSLGFTSPRSRPDQARRRPPPPTHVVLPVLTRFCFKGASEYLEDLVASIDAPRLAIFDINFINDIVFDMPQLIQFIGRTPMLNPFEKASISFDKGHASVSITSPSSHLTPFQGLLVRISCKELDRLVSFVELVCTSCLPPLFILEDLCIWEVPYSPPVWEDNIENTLWLELLRPFTAVRNLYLSKEFAPRIVPALQELNGSRTTEVLPALENIFLEGFEPAGPVHEGIGQFVATRQVTGHPIAVSCWGRESSLYFEVSG